MHFKYFIWMFISINTFAKISLSAQSVRDNAELMYTLVFVDYEWETEYAKQDAMARGEYIMENNLITGIKVHGDDVYVTVPRWRKGIPSTLNKLITASNGTILRPFPSWRMNTIGDCDAFQYVQSMEVDPNTGFMWIIDTGRIKTIASPMLPENLCPPKLIILNLNDLTIVRKFIFPRNVVSPASNFMNDIVLDYVNGKVGYAYITDTAEGKLYVYDYNKNTAYSFQHNSMSAVPLIPGVQDDLISAAIDGIAISSDFQFVYYCTLPAWQLYAIPTDVLRNRNSNFSENLMTLGIKAGGSDGMIYGEKSLFYGVFEQSAVYKARAEVDGGLVSFSTQQELISNTTSVVWTDTFAYNGTNLWFIANTLNLFARNQMNFQGTKPNMFIWRVNVGERSYLDGADKRTVHHGVGSIIG